jgi:hypothetical protein
MAGSNYQTAVNTWQSTGLMLATSNQFNFMGTNGNTFELFDVSLTEGSVAPPFVVPDYASELLACQRYWRKNAIMPGSFVNAVVLRVTAQLAPVMRSTPTFVVLNGTGMFEQFGSSFFNVSAPAAAAFMSNSSVHISLTVAGGTANWTGALSGDCMSFNARL